MEEAFARLVVAGVYHCTTLLLLLLLLFQGYKIILWIVVS
jgi:hypothetical protein